MATIHEYDLDDIASGTSDLRVRVINDLAGSPASRNITTANLLAHMLDTGDLTAEGVSVEDTGANYTGDNVEDVLAELAPAQFLKTTGGVGDTIHTLVDVTGATSLDLADGNVQFVSSSTGAHTFTVDNAGEGALSFVLVSDASHTPTWFSGITWVNGIETIAWDGTREVFSFLSINGGTNWLGWHLSPQAPVESASFSYGGTLATFTGGMRLYNDSGADREIVSVRAAVGTAPTGDTVLVDVNVNGTTIFTTQSNRPEIAISGNTDTATTIQAGEWDAGEYLTVDVDQIGSGTEGSDLVVTVNYRAT